MNQAARRILDGSLVLLSVGLAVLISRGVAAPDAAQAPAPSRLARDPLDLAALRDWGLQLDRRGRLAQADAVLSFVSQRTWRDGPTQVWLLRRRLAQGRYREAFESADSLLRRDADGTARPVLFDLLMAASDDTAEARRAVVARLEAAPWWRADFLRALATRGSGGAEAVFSDLALGPTPPSPDEYAPLVNRLVTSGDYDGAYAAWLSVARTHGATAGLRDGDFAGASDHTPFTWSAASGPGASSATEVAPGTHCGNPGSRVIASCSRALRVEYDGYSTPDLPAQLLARLPKRYLLTWRERVDPAVPERLFWRVRCAGTDKVLARAPPPIAGWRTVTLTVEPPEAACPAQWLELAAEPGERRDPVTGAYAAFRINVSQPH
jgi:hypothetical protein